MRKIKYQDLLAIIDFLYYGEANIYQENLEIFLAIAEELKLKGLTGGNKEEKNDSTLDNHFKKIKTQNKEPVPLFDRNNGYNQEDIPYKEEFPERAVMIQNPIMSGELLELDVKIKSMMVPGKQIMPNGKRAESKCIVCGKEGKYQNIKDHIELHHIDGISHHCNFCEKTFRSRPSLRMHNNNSHR